jgi:lysozyme
VDTEAALFAIERHYTAADIPPGLQANASSIINEHGIRLVSQFEGPPRLKARLCEGGRFELGRGITFHFDGRPVLEGETCDEAYAEALFVNALSVFAKAVDELVTVPINANQRAALTILGYNIGIENLKSSTVLRETNEGRFDDSAAAFGMWVFATKNSYKQALRGLLRRQYATACLYLSL